MPARRRPGAGGLRLIPGIPRAPERARVLENPEERGRVPEPACPASVLSAPGGARPARGALAVSAGSPDSGPETLGDRDPLWSEGGCSCSRDDPAPADPGPERSYRPGSKAPAESRSGRFLAAWGLRDQPLSAHFLPAAQNRAAPSFFVA